MNELIKSLKYHQGPKSEHGLSQVVGLKSISANGHLSLNHSLNPTLPLAEIDLAQVVVDYLASRLPSQLVGSTGRIEQ